ncbi:MAG: radical SAM protein [Candidatus Methanofastidiosia archaeon]|jgi:radical SAM superfamily enzyme YgiQ (UPF0313 family)
MRITLVKPPENSKLNFGTFSLAVLAAAVRDIAEVTIVDTTHFDIDAAVDHTLRTRPNIIGITTMGLASVKPAFAFIKSLRTAYEGLLLAGGHGATMSPGLLLAAGADAVVCGEGEKTFKEILQKGVSPRIKGLALLHKGKIVKTPPRELINPLDVLPQPAYDLIESSDMVLLETSRGCPHACTFCETSRFYHCVWRPRSPEVVARDVQQITKEGATIIHLVDDNFTASPKRALRICELLQKGDLPLFFFFSARTDDLLKIPELIPALARAHFLRAGIGIETLEPELAHTIKKPILFEQHCHAVTAMKKVGILVVASFILGLPGETEEMRERCVDLAVKVGVDAAHFVPFQPLPGTPLEKGDGLPEPWAVKAAAEATNQFRCHPVVLNRLLEASKETTVRGMLARAGLARQVREHLLPPQKAAYVTKELNHIDPRLLR